MHLAKIFGSKSILLQPTWRARARRRVNGRRTGSADQGVPGGRGGVPVDQETPEGRQGVLAKRDGVPAGQGGLGRGPEMPNNNSSIPYTVKHPHMPDVV